MRFLVNKDSSAAVRPLDTVSHSTTFDLVACIFFFKGLGHRPIRVYQNYQTGHSWMSARRQDANELSLTGPAFAA